MAAQKGRDLLLKVEDSPGGGAFTTIAGLRTNTLTINNEAVDITTKDSSGKRELLEGAGVNSLSVSGEGVADDDAALELVRVAANANTHLNFQLVDPATTNGGTYEGEFMIESFEQTGEYNGAVTFTITLQSAAAITFS